MLLFAQVADRFQQILNNLKLNIDSMIVDKAPLVAERVIPAVLIFFVGQWAAKHATRLLSRALTKAKVDETLGKFLSRFGYAALMVAVGLAALNQQYMVRLVDDDANADPGPLGIGSVHARDYSPSPGSG